MSPPFLMGKQSPPQHPVLLSANSGRAEGKVALSMPRSAGGVAIQKRLRATDSNSETHVCEPQLFDTDCNCPIR